MLFSHKDLTVQDADVVTADLLHFRKRPTRGFSDCLTLEVARKADHTLGTLDRDLGKLNGTMKL